MSIPSIAVIGAGLSGLTVARELQDIAQVTVFEKSRGLGGRLATRYADAYQFDHGAQHFTIKSEAFQALIDPLITQGVVARWDARFVELEREKITGQRQWGDDNPHYVGFPKMNALGKALAEGMDIHRACRIETMIQQQNQWVLVDDKGQQHGPYDWVVCSAPAQQAAELLPNYASFYDRVKNTQLLGCYALMVGMETPLALPFDAALVKQADISWVSINSSKPGRETGFSVLAHATNAWAEAHMEDDIAQVQTHLLNELSDIIGHDLHQADHIAVHRWRYSNISKQSGEAALIDMDNRLVACGDWCIHGRVESAFLSGLAAAEYLRKAWT